MTNTSSSGPSGPDTTPASITELGSTSDGLTQLRRHWAPVLGEGEQAKAAMLIVHGIGEHSGRYEHVGGAFAARGIDVVGFDNRGFGQSGGARAYVDSFDDYLGDVQVLIEKRAELGVPVILLGHSLGGLICTAYLVSDRPKPDLAVLSSPALLAHVPAWQRVLAPVLGKVLPRAFIPSKIDGTILSRDVEVQQAYVNDPLVIAGATAGLGNEIFTTMESTMDSLDKLTVPTYVLHGDGDELVPPAASMPLAELDCVTRVEWPGLRHECMNEPEQGQVLAAIGDWIDDQLI